MIGTASNKKKLHLPPPPKGWRAFREYVMMALRRIAAADGVTLQIEGSSATSLADGTLHFSGTGSSGAGSCINNWQPTFVRNDGEGNDIVTLEPGSLAGVTVTVGGTDILAYPRPELSIPDDADTTQIVYLKADSVTESLVDSWVDYIVVGTATIEVGTTLPSNSVGTTSTLYLELFRWRNGALESQITKYNVALYGRGASGAAQFTFLYAAG